MKKPVPTAKKAVKKATPTKAPPKQKEKKPIAKKSAKKREAVLPIKKASKPRAVGKHPALAAPYGKSPVADALDATRRHTYVVGIAGENIEAGMRMQVDKSTGYFVKSDSSEGTIFGDLQEHIINMVITQLRADSRAITRQDICALIFSPKKKKRDLLGEEDKTFDSVVFKACLDLLSTATREPVFQPAQYAAALRDCEASGLDVSAMLEVDIVSTWETADIERLISYLTTLCHIKRAYRSASETIPLAEVRQTTTA